MVDQSAMAGVDLECKGRYCGETSLHLAAFLGRVILWKILVRAGANVEARIDGVGETVIMRGLNSPNAVEIIETLLDAGADVNATDAQGRTAMHYAIDRCSCTWCVDVLKCLHEAGANVNIRCTEYGNTPLHALASIDLQQRQYELNVRELEAELLKGPVNAVSARQRAIRATAMPKRVEVKDEANVIPIVNLLLDWGADTSGKNFRGDGPLPCAIRARNIDVAFVLLWRTAKSTEFTMDKLGDQEFLEALEEIVADMKSEKR